MSYIGPAPNPGQNREVDDISSGFNGSEVNFTLQVNSQNVSPGSSNNIIVSLGGVVQNPSTDYTVAASTLTFTTAPANGLSFFGLVLGQQVDIQSVADSASIVSPTLSNPTVTGDLSIADKIVHTGDTNNAIRFPAADTITAETGGSERVRVDSSGRVGIGTNNPDQKLKIEDSSDLAIHLLKTGAQDTLLKNTGQTELCAATGGASGQRIVFKIGANTGALADIARFTPDGLCFGSDTAAANALDDYEEGTWTPNIRNEGATSTWTTQQGRYVKIGQQVTVWFNADGGSTPRSGGAGTSLIMTGLPFSQVMFGNPILGIIGANDHASSGLYSTSGLILNAFGQGGTQVRFGCGGQAINKAINYVAGCFTYTMS